MSHQRDLSIASLRPSIKTDQQTTTGAEETFQNTVLRPILKYQHDILVAIADDALTHRKKKVNRSSPIAFAADIEVWLKQDHKTKDQLITLAVALMTESELQYYLTHRSDINRRINTMVIKRLIDHWCKDFES